MLLTKIDGVQPLLDGYLRTTVPAGKTLDEIKKAILKGFEEDDKRRGTPYLERTRRVSNNYTITYSKPVEFTEGEEPLPVDGLAGLGIDFGEFGGTVDTPTGTGDATEYDDISEELDSSESVEGNAIAFLAGRIASAPVASGGNGPEINNTRVPGTFLDEETFDVSLDEDGYDDWFEYYPKPKEKPSEVAEVVEVVEAESKVEVAEAEDTQVEVKKPPAKRVPTRPKRTVPARPTTTAPSKPAPTAPGKPAPAAPGKPALRESYAEFDELFDSPKNTPTSRPSVQPKVTEEGYRTLRDLVKNNPGCSVDFASRYFSKREIKKAVTLGTVFVKNGKLSV